MKLVPITAFWGPEYCVKNCVVAPPTVETHTHKHKGKIIKRKYFSKNLQLLCNVYVFCSFKSLLFALPGIFGERARE